MFFFSVPEMLRAILRETESSPSERVGLNHDGNSEVKVESKSRKEQSTEKRTRRARANNKQVKEVWFEGFVSGLWKLPI